MKKHKIFLYPLEENGKVRVFLFQSGDIGDQRASAHRDYSLNVFNHRGYNIRSYQSPEITTGGIYVNGGDLNQNFNIDSKSLTKEEFDKLKELEYAYNNR